MTEERKEYIRKWKSENRDKTRRHSNKWYAENKEKIRPHSPKRHPIKDKARELLNYHLRVGNILRKPCEVCRDVKSEGHHDNYEKPMDVRWLCRKHHMELHRKYPENQINN